MIKGPFNRFTYTGYRKDPRKLYNSVTFAPYPNPTHFNTVSMVLLFPPEYGNVPVPNRVCIMYLISSLSSTLLLILDILFFIDRKMKPFLTVSFMHIYRTASNDDRNHNWIV
jgi:hypothetical protein